MSKLIDVYVSDRDVNEIVQLEEDTTVTAVLASAHCSSNYNLAPGKGRAPFGKDECIYRRVTDCAELFASPTLGGEST